MTTLPIAGSMVLPNLCNTSRILVPVYWLSSSLINIRLRGIFGPIWVPILCYFSYSEFLFLVVDEPSSCMILLWAVILLNSPLQNGLVALESNSIRLIRGYIYCRRSGDQLVRSFALPVQPWWVGGTRGWAMIVVRWPHARYHSATSKLVGVFNCLTIQLYKNL